MNKHYVAFAFAVAVVVAAYTGNVACAVFAGIAAVAIEGGT